MSSRVQVIADRYAADLSSGKRGGMSVVYRANDVQTATTVALKLFRSVAESEERQLLAEAFRREVSALRALEHPNIVKLLDAEAAPEDGQPYLVLEWMSGTLSEHMKNWPEEDGWEPFYERVARPLLEALNFAHERYCIHRDVKPSNVLVAADGQVKLADFGISKLKEWLTPGVTLAEFQSRPYAPLEPDEGTYSYTRDVFGFAVTMLECFTGTRPVRYEDLEQILDQFDAPPAVSEVMERAVSVDPAARPRNAGALLRELDRIHRRRSDTWKDQVHFQVLPPHRDRITAATGESTFERANSDSQAAEVHEHTCRICVCRIGSSGHRRIRRPTETIEADDRRTSRYMDRVAH